MLALRTIAFVVPLLLLPLVGCNNSSSSPSASGVAAGKTVKLLNVSYDPTREFYVEFNYPGES